MSFSIAARSPWSSSKTVSNGATLASSGLPRPAPALAPGKHHLRIHRMLDPERAVLIERGDAFRGRDKVGRAFFRHFDKLDDGFSSPGRRSTRPTGLAREEAQFPKKKSERGFSGSCKPNLSEARCARNRTFVLSACCFRAGILHATKTEMIGPGIDLSFAPGAHDVTRTVIGVAKKRTAAMNLLFFVRLSRIER